MTAAWVYPEVGPMQVQGRDLSEDNFAQEERSNLEILIREVLQNPLDARASDNCGPVKVRMSVLRPGTFDADYLAALLNGEYASRLEASGGEPLLDFAKATVLVIEDFGTTGLLGNWNDQNADGQNENWNAFWFREGEGAKPTAGSNGRAGQGKITYYRIGAARAVFGLTVRKSDGARLLMGRSAFRRVYPFNGSKYLRHAFWNTSITSKEQATPVTDENEIMTFRKAFNLTRLSEAGLSLVIPFPMEFDGKLAVQTIITDFYYPIAKGNLEVHIGDTPISASNIDGVAQHVLPDHVARERKSSFTNGFRELVQKTIAAEKSGALPAQIKAGWDRTSSIKEDAFPADALQSLRDAMENGDPVSIRCPVTVRPKKGEPVQSWFDVHIEVPEDLDRVEEAYIRRDLLIGSERHLASSAYLQKARSVTLITEATLSAFLADAEEPTHLKWNGSRPRLAEDYSNPQATLRAVRNAAPRLLAIISNGMVSRDTKALARYFTRPVEESRRHTGGGTRQGGKDVTTTTTPPLPVRKPFRIVTTSDSVRVLPNGAAALKTEDLPVNCSLEVAYEGLDQDPFKAYDPFDFDLADNTLHAVTASGVNILERRGNNLVFEVADPVFALTIPGFDPNLRLRARLNYMERKDGTPVSEE